MNQSLSFRRLTRRRFIGLLAAMGVSLPWLAYTRPSSRLSTREATFYRREDGSNR